MSRTYKAQYPASLPPTPCNKDMRDAIESAAQNEGVSIAEIQRRAFSLFLQQNYSQTIVLNSQNIEMSVPA